VSLERIISINSQNCYLEAMDLGNIVYVVAVLAYFIYQATKKKREGELPEGTEESPEPPKKGMTFEDLLKEIREAQNPFPTQPEAAKPEPVRPIPAPIPVPQFSKPSRKPVLVEEVDEEVSHYEGSFEKNKTNPYAAYQNTHSIPSTPVKRIDYDSLYPKKVNPYAELLKNPKTLKDAVVVSEILKPKYF
jgi:hypothetical protein